MASLGALVVSVSANITQFASAMDKAGHISAKNMATMRDNANIAGKAIAAAFLAGTAAAGVLVKQAIDSADAMSKMAQKAGVSVEAFSTLAYAAKLSGVEVNQLQGAMSRLGSTMLDVSNGSNKDATEAFRRLGISVTDANGRLKDSDVIMAEVAARFALMEDSSEKTALAIKIFGRAGADLIPLLNAGATGLKQMQDEARALGVELSGKVGPAAERFNDNLTRLNTVKLGFANQIMTAVLPSLNAMTDALVRSAIAGNSFANVGGAVKTVFDTIIVLGANVAYVFKAIGIELGGMAAQVTALATLDFKAFSAIGKMMKEDAIAARKEVDAFSELILNGIPEKVIKKLGGPNSAVLDIDKMVGTVATVYAGLASAAAPVNAEVERLIDALVAQADLLGKSEKEAALWSLTLAGANDEQKKFADTILSFVEAKKKEIDAMAEGARITQEMKTPLEQYTERVSDLTALVMQGAINWDTYGRAVQAAQDSLDRTQKTVNVVKEKMSEMDEFSKNAAKSIQDSIGDGLYNMLTGKFDGIGKSFGQMILKMIAQAQAAQIARAMFGGLVEGGSGSGLFGTALSYVGRLFGGGKAIGGPVTGGTTYLVGERGPELFTPSTSGAITPNSAIGGGPNITVYQNFTVGDVATVSMVRDAVAGSERRIGGALSRSMRYGGAMA
jgi:hypothetical protein